MPHLRPDHRRPNPHGFFNDPDNPGCCRICHIPDSPRKPRNAVHSGVAAHEQHRAELAAERAEGYIDTSVARHIREEAEKPG